MSVEKTKRRVIPVEESFFNDGYWYVLSSSSLGGSGLSPSQIAERLQTNDSQVMNQLLQKGICLPLYFPGDCALDNGIIVIGDLTEQEKAEWIGCLRSKLEIPCGEFMVMGGGLEEGFEVALEHFKAPDPHYTFFQKVKLDPGTYLVEIYAYISSMTVNFAWDDFTKQQETINVAWDDLTEEPETIESWWKRTRPSQEYPKWLNSYLEEDYVDSDDHNLVEYIIRLTPAKGEIPLPQLEEDTNWCGVFEIRKPELCPLGISRKSLPV